MESPVHYSVYLLDPRFIDHHLANWEVKKRMNWLKSKAGEKWSEFKPTLRDMLHRRGVFKDEDWRIGIDEDPLKPFDDLDVSIDYEEYVEWAMDLLQINGTSIALEKSFKAFRVVHDI